MASENECVESTQRKGGEAAHAVPEAAVLNAFRELGRMALLIGPPSVVLATVATTPGIPHQIRTLALVTIALAPIWVGFLVFKRGVPDGE